MTSTSPFPPGVPGDPPTPATPESTAPADSDASGVVVALDEHRRRADRRTGGDTSFEVVWDHDDEDAEQAAPVFVDLPPDANADGRRPIIPPGLRGSGLLVTVRQTLGRWGYIVGFHTVRAPWYAVQTLFWAPVGAVRLTAHQLAWWWVSEQAALRQAAADTNDAATWLRLHREARDTRRWRGTVLAAEAIAVLLAFLVLPALAPHLLLITLVCATIVTLARAGRPAGRRIVAPAVVSPRFRKLTADIVLRAYYAAKLGDPDKSHLQVAFGSPMARDRAGIGSQVVIDLPYGKQFDDAVKAKGAIASGLDVSANQVFLTADPTSVRRHLLFVADRDPLSVPAGRTPLLDGKVRDIWAPAPFGLDERGRPVEIPLMWISILIGAQPRKGKTFSARLLALFAALDPYVTLFVVDGKNSPDWRKFTLVADTYIHGTHPDRDGDPVEHLLVTLRRVKKHIEKVNDQLSRLPVDVCPEGKLTRDLARDPRYPELRVWALVMEEFQVYYELDNKDASAEIAQLLSFIMAVGPSSGVFLLSSSQKPSGIGATQDIGRLFVRYRDNHAVRFALKCGNRLVSEAILGGDAYAEGYDASALPVGKKYRGVGYLYGLTDDTPTVRTHLADHVDTEKILTAARRHRIAAGTLTGMAAGETVVREVRDVVTDTLAVVRAGETGLHWQEIADRLADAMPEHYADVTADTISAQLRGLGVPSKDVKRDGRVAKGARVEAIRTTATRRPAHR